MAVSASMANSKNMNLKKRKSIDELSENFDSKKPKLDDEDDVEVETGDTKKITYFSVAEFRATLGTVDGLKSLRNFANCAEWKTTENDVVLEYLQAGGTISEISSLLDITAQGDLATALPVFRAIYCILIKIQAEAKEHQEAARQSINNLISSYTPTFQAMIDLNSAKHRKVMFKLMSAIVAFHSSYGRQILNWFSLTPQQLEQFTEPGPLRRSFVMFLVSFFVDGKASTFRPLIDKKGYLSAIIPNLKYDDAKTVTVVLAVLKDKLLMNPGVTKSQKLIIFNTQIIQSLFQLFDWVGPKAARKGWKKPKKLSAVDEESLSMVSATLEEFLTVLCACRKNGIAFHDKTLGSGPQLNQLILTALDALPKPWKKPETCNVVLAILEQSPDLIKHCFLKWESSLEPRDSLAWTTAMNFLIKIIESINAEAILSSASEVLSPQQLQNALKALLLSPAILKHLSAAMSVEKSVEMRSYGLKLLTVIIDKLNEFTVSNEQLKRNLKQMLRSLIPSALWICEMWKSCDSYKTISDFLLSLAKFEITFLNNPRRVCKTLIKDIETKESNVQSAVLQTISLTDPTFLSPDSELFEDALKILFELSWEEKPAGGAVCALSNMLLNTGLWNEHPKSLDCWIGAWLSLSEKMKSTIAVNFVQCVKKTHQKGTAIIDEMFSLKGKKYFGEYLKDVALHLGCVAVLPSDYEFILDFESICQKDFERRLQCNEVEEKFIHWLYKGVKIDSTTVLQLTVFGWDRIFAFIVQFVKFWITSNNFDEEKQERSRECLELVLNSIPENARRLGKSLLSVDPTFQTFYNKSMAQIFGDVFLVQQFCVDEENPFMTWLKDVIISLKLSKNRVNCEYLDELKSRLLKQLRKIVKGEEKFLSNDLEFWMMFFEPSVSDLTPIFEQLCSEIDAKSQNGRVWLTALRVVKSQVIPSDLGTGLVGFLCRNVVSPGIMEEYCEALLELVTCQPLLILEIPKDFVKNLLKLDVISDKLINVGECCVQARSHKSAFLEAVASGSFNGRAALALLDRILQYPGASGVLRSALNQPMESLTLTKIVSVVGKAARKVLKRFIRGEEDVLLQRHLPTVLLAIQAIGKKEKKAKSLISELNGAGPRIEVLEIMISLANRFEPSLVLPWIKTLLTSSDGSPSWEKQANAMRLLLKNEGYLKAFVDLRQSREWDRFVNSTLRSLSLDLDPFKIDMLRAVTAATWSEGADNKDLAKIFHKCTSHSEFLTVMLSNTRVKAEMVGLLLEIIRFWPSVMLLGHIPVYLSAYGATLSSCDQIILEILRKYEVHCGSLSKFDPLFWGEPAIAHYSVKGAFGLSLWKQVSMKSVLELIDVDKLKYSMSHFPINRKLQENIMDPDPEVYDPSFLLPLFSNLFSPGAAPYCLSFISHGALSYTIAALSSKDPEIRGAAAVVLSRFYGHLQLSQYAKQKPIWLHIIDCIRYGSENLASVPIPGVVTLFLARAVSEVADPASQLHILHKYLLAKPFLNLSSLTEFSRLFFSDDPSYLEHRKWILEIIRDGIRQETDVQVLTKGSILKILLTSFGIMSIEHKVLILEVVSSILRAKTNPKIVIDEMGLFAWMYNLKRHIHGNLMKPYLSVLQSCVQYLLVMEEKDGKITKKLCNVARLESAILQVCHKSVNLEGIVKILRVEGSKTCDR